MQAHLDLLARHALHQARRPLRCRQVRHIYPMAIAPSTQYATQLRSLRMQVVLMTSAHESLARLNDERLDLRGLRRRDAESIAKAMHALLVACAPLIEDAYATPLWMDVLRQEQTRVQQWIMSNRAEIAAGLRAAEPPVEAEDTQLYIGQTPDVENLTTTLIFSFVAPDISNDETR